MMSNKDTIVRLYHSYTKRFLGKIIISFFLSMIVAASTSSIAWLLDPAIKKLFIEKDQALILIIPFAMSAAVPKLTSPVIDQAGLLSKKQKIGLKNILILNLLFQEICSFIGSFY